MKRLMRPVLTPVILAVLPAAVNAQWSQVHEQFYLQASHNWEFRDTYRTADRLFNAFDYGHAILYELLYTQPNAPASRLEEEEYDFITKKLLVKPPRLPLEEGAIEIAYVKLVPEAKAMFEWAHVLHRQIYDVLADESLSQARKDAEIAALLRYYRSRPDVAFSSQPKTMELMEGQYYSTAFRDRYPKFNGLIWAYHWLQVGLYEPLMVGTTLDERQTGVTGTVARFWQMLEDAPTYMPRIMPMTAAVAPTFAERYPEAAIIFDNLHAMHDVISDILASPEVPRGRKRDEVLRAAARYRDAASFVMTESEWRQMALAMGIENMAGPAVGFLPEFPTPTVERGAVMAGMDHAGMRGMPGMQHDDMPAMADSVAAGHELMDHAAMPTRDTVLMQHGGADGVMQQMMAVHQRMMDDPVIRERVMSDSTLSRMMQQLDASMMATPLPQHGGDAAMPAADSAAAREAMQFIMMLLDDPAVEARIHADPRLHGLWSDPAVQECLDALRTLRRQGRPLPAVCPAPVGAPAHRH